MVDGEADFRVGYLNKDTTTSKERYEGKSRGEMPGKYQTVYN